MSRKGAFDLSRLDEIDDLPPPPGNGADTQTPVPEVEPSPAAETTAAEQAPPTPTADSSTRMPSRADGRDQSAADRDRAPSRGRARGAGRRLPVGERTDEEPSTAAPTGLVVVAVRVPWVLYTTVVGILSGPERSSYGQLVAWTCKDAADEVLEALQRLLEPPPRGRRPRSRRIAAATVQVTLRMRPDELAALDAVVSQASGMEAQVTRTKAVIAALEVAVRREVPG